MTTPTTETWVTWVEPWYGPGELPVHVELRCTREHAINAVRNAHPDTTLSDDQLLEEFLTIHWARVE